MTELRPTFSYSQALATLPSVKQATHAAVRQIEALLNRVQSREEMERRREEIEQAMDSIIELWTERVTELGARASGLWFVDWDSGGGSYCWQYPQETISFFRPATDDGPGDELPIN